MKLIIDIPKEFETDYKGDKFKDFFSRVLCDIGKGVLCGNYEKETAEMFLKAFDESIPMANIVEKLEYEKERHEKDRAYWSDKPWKDSCVYNEYDMADRKIDCYDDAINIVKQEINNGLE